MSLLRAERPPSPIAPPAWMGFVEANSILVLSHPDAIKHVLHDNHANYVKGELYDDLRGLLGHGVLTSDGDTWLSERKLVQPAFHAAALEAYHAVMVDTIAAFLREWRSRLRPGSPRDISRDMSRLTLRVIVKSLFQLDVVEKEDSILDSISELFLSDPMLRGRVVGRLYRYLPFWARLRARKALRTFEEAVEWIIQHRSSSADLISRLTAGSPDAVDDATNRRIRDEVATFVIAGYETSAIGLTWALYLLSQHPEVERRLRDEIAAVVGPRPPSPADLPRLTYTTMVIRETLRLYPPIPTFGRQALRDDEIAGFKILANTRVRIKPILTHRHPDFWPDPERFSPERFSADQSAARAQCAYIPFGAGPRTCIGNHFAMMEMKVALVMLLQAVRFTASSDRPVAQLSNLTLRPRYGMWMIPDFSRGQE